jgi:hypothetical protein
MRPFAAALFTAAFAVPGAAQAAPAASPALGDWHVTGDVSGHAFALDCHFAPAGAGFGGTCAKAGADKVLRLNSGSVAGDKVTWSYPVTRMLMTFDMTFAGHLAGGRITGTASAAGRSGTFVATRK